MHKLATVGPSQIRIHAENFTDVADLLNAESGFGAVIFSSPPQPDELINLRQHAGYDHCLLYIDSTDPVIQALSDGPCPVDLNSALTEYHDRLAGQKTANRGPEGKLLTYLWLNETREIKACRDTRLAQVYYFPLLSALLEIDPARQLSYLASLKTRNFIGQRDLVDITRHCTQCGSGLLNYTEVCPACHSHDLSAFTPLHCFTCGHVDQQDAFVDGERLTCPNCLSTLLHIGVDYDRPLESVRCNSCHEVVTQGDVVARCYHCNHANQPAALRQQRITDYRISPTGQNYVLTGELKSYERLNIGEPVSHHHFQWAVDWTAALNQRHAAHSVLMVMKLSTPALSHIDQLLQLERIHQRINATFRKTDISCLGQDSEVWLLLPQTDLSQAAGISKKVEQVIASEELAELTVDIRFDALSNLSQGGSINTRLLQIPTTDQAA